MDKSKKTLSRIDFRRFCIGAIAILASICLFFAHVLRGSDDLENVQIFTAIFLALAVVLTLITPQTRWIWLIFGLIGAAALWPATGLTGNWYQAQPEIFALWTAIAILLIGFILGQSRTNNRFMWKAMTWALLAFCLLSLFIHYSSLIVFSDQSHLLEWRRLRSSFGSPNTAATLFGLAMVLAASRLAYKTNQSHLDGISRSFRMSYIIRSEFSSFALLICAGSCLLLTASRAGFAATITMLVVLVTFEAWSYIKRASEGNFKPRRTLLILTSIPTAVAVIIGIGGISMDFLSDRAVTTVTDTSSRLVLFAEYWPKALEEPWFGHGLGSFNRVNDELISLNNAPSLEMMGAAHNIVLQWFLQQGIVGLTILLALLVWIHLPIFKALGLAENEQATPLRMSLCAGGLVFAHGMVDYAMEIPSVMWTYALLLGLGLGCATRLIGSSASGSPRGQ